MCGPDPLGGCAPGHGERGGAVAGDSAARKPPAPAGAAIAPPPPAPSATARALAVRIVLPSGRVVASATATGDVAGGRVTTASFSYPADGSVIVTGGTAATARTRVGRTAAAASVAGASNISIFDGEITADSASAHASSSDCGARCHGRVCRHGCRPPAGTRAPARLWPLGALELGLHDDQPSYDRSSRRRPGSRPTTGSRSRSTSTCRARTGVCLRGARSRSATRRRRRRRPRPPRPQIDPEAGDRPQLLPPATGPLIGVPQVVAPPLTAGPYDFPVYGPSSSTDRYGDAKQDETWQHGVDIFGELGQPLVAVADGTLYSIGWNHASGNRVWLRDRQGNQFLYAHLSAFTLAARNGAHVRVGQVIGFMGDTGNTGRLSRRTSTSRFIPVSIALPRLRRRRRSRRLLRLLAPGREPLLPRGDGMGAEGPGHDQGPGARGLADRQQRHLDGGRPRPCRPSRRGQRVREAGRLEPAWLKASSAPAVRAARRVVVVVPPMRRDP